jgi:excisionase family DNA binding protein
MLTITQAAEKTGFPKHILVSAVRAGSLKAVSPSGHRGRKYIFPDELDRWLETLNT